MKLARKVVCCVLVFALLFGFAMPVRAWELPTEISFDFATEYRLAISTEGFGSSTVADEILANGIELGIGGTFVARGPLAFSFYTEVSLDLTQFLDVMGLPPIIAMMLPQMGIDLAEPLRVWMEMDINDVSNPTYVIVIEWPSLVRVLLAMTAPELAQQYWVLDLSDILAESAAELELALQSVSAEQQAQNIAYLEEALHEALAIWQEFMEEYEDEIADLIAEAYALFREIFTLRELNYGHERLDNGHSAFLDFAFTAAYEGSSVCVDFSFAGEITNIGTAVAAPLPQLHSARFLANSVDLVALFGF